MTLETEVAALTTATTDLLQAVNVSKATLDNSKNSAADSAAVATTKATEAAGSASSALAIYGNTAAVNSAVTQATTAASTSTTKATEAANSATQSAASAASAAAIVTGVSSNRPSVRPSLLLDFQYTKQLDPRITFSRPTTATYYDGKTVVKAEENLVTYSQEFDNAAWTKNSSATITANTVTAPDGTNTADTLTSPNGGSGTFGVYQAISTSAGSTISLYAKAGTGTYLGLSTQNASGNGAVFNLSTGVVHWSSGATASIVSAGNGWYRCSVNMAASGAFALISIRDTLLTSAWGGSADTGLGNTIYLWGAQMEQRSAVTAYTPTTSSPITNYIPALQTALANVPRFDCNPTTSESLGLLIEEQRTNLLTYSEQFDNSSWSKTALSVNSNVVVAPDGSSSADLIIENTANTTHYINKGVSVTTGTSYTYTIYAKSAGRNFAMFATGAVTNSGRGFNLTNGTTQAAGNSYADASAYSITPIGNGWYRCSITVTTTSTGNTDFGIWTLNSGGSGSYAGDGYSGIYIWGAQLEAGSFPTSYIPTVASQVTRSADSASMTGANFSSWYRADEGTLYADGVALAQSYFIAGSLNDGSSTNLILVDQTGANARLFIRTNSTTYTNIAASISSASLKCAGVYKTNDAIVCANSSLSTADSDVILPTVTRFDIGKNVVAPATASCTIKRIAYYPKRLSNTELQGLTS